MRIIFLNTWSAKQKQEMEKFIKEQAPRTDIFCLQEVEDSIKPFFERLLKGFSVFYTARQNAIKDPGDLDPCNATYIKKGLAGNISSHSILKDVEEVGLDLCTKIELDKAIVHLANIHGQNRPGDKLDTPERLVQSKAIIKHFTPLVGVKIIGGDFNLMPDTKSIKMFEEAGYRNLIKEYNIKTTRNRFAWKMYPETPQYFADYVFCGPDVKINKFEVINNEVSDHLPMVLDISL